MGVYTLGGGSPNCSWIVTNSNGQIYVSGFTTSRQSPIYTNTP